MSRSEIGQGNRELEPEVRPRFLYALRRPGREGWLLRATGEARDLPSDWSTKPEAPVLAVRLVSKHWSRSRQGEPSGVTEGDAVMFGMESRWEGWCYDEEGECWRAPDEPVTEPPGDPRRAGSARFTPEGVCGSFFGWMYFRLQVGRGWTRVRASPTFDPLDDILEFSRRLLGEGYPRLYIEEEGESHTFHTFPRAPGEIRLLAIADRKTWRRSRDGYRRHRGWETVPVVDQVVLRAVLATALRDGLAGTLALSLEERRHWCRKAVNDFSEEAMARYEGRLRAALQRWPNG